MCRLIQIRTNILSISVLNVPLFQTLKVIQYVEFKQLSAKSKEGFIFTTPLELHLTLC